MDTETRCNAWVQFGSCPNKVKVERNGKGYCGVHDPDRLKGISAARRARTRARWDAEAAVLRAKADLARLRDRAADWAYQNNCDLLDQLEALQQKLDEAQADLGSKR
jgi:hypothetical protein